MAEVVKHEALISDQLDSERLYMHNFQHILNRLTGFVWLMNIKLWKKNFEI